MNPPASSSALALLLALSAPAQALVLAPQYAGVFLDGDGANSRWVQVADDRRGSLNGSESWGTGIWVHGKEMTKIANTTTARWYLCECERPSCREEFYMKVREYENVHLGNWQAGSAFPQTARRKGAFTMGWRREMIQKEKKANGNR